MTDTATIIGAMRALANAIESPDGVSNAAIAEAADRLEELEVENRILKQPHLYWNADGDGEAYSDLNELAQDAVEWLDKPDGEPALVRLRCARVLDETILIRIKVDDCVVHFDIVEGEE